MGREAGGGANDAVAASPPLLLPAGLAEKAVCFLKKKEGRNFINLEWQHLHPRRHEDTKPNMMARS